MLKMWTRYAFLLIISLALVVVNCAEADTQVQGDLKTGEKGKIVNAANETNSGNDKKAVIPEEKNEKDQAGGGSKKGAESNNSSVGNGEPGKVGGNEADDGKKGTNNPEAKEKGNTGGDSKPVESKGTGNELKKTDNKVADNKINLDANSSKDEGSKGTGNERTESTGSELKTTNEKDSEKKKTNEKGTKKGGETKEKASGANLDSKDGTLVQGKKEGGEACDSSSNSCTIEDKSVVACLRVPGNESPELSLLIQNKGKGPVNVTISAPDFAKLEKTQVQLKENSNEKVMVFVGPGNSDSKIILKAGKGNCGLDFRGMITTQSSKKNPGFTQLAYFNVVNNTSYVWYILLAVVLVIASAWIVISFRRKFIPGNAPKYEKLEMELPVSGASKPLPVSKEEGEGWDDNWDDNWDDEEVGLAPSLPVTPSFSPNGSIASRRVIKDAWKD